MIREPRSSKSKFNKTFHESNPLLVLGFAPPFLVLGLPSLVFWGIVLAGLALVAVAVAGVLYARKRARSRPLSRTQEILLWSELGKLTGLGAPKYQAGLAKALSGPEGGAPASGAMADLAQADRASELFRTLREDQGDLFAPREPEVQNVSSGPPGVLFGARPDAQSTPSGPIGMGVPGGILPSEALRERPLPSAGFPNTIASGFPGLAQEVEPPGLGDIPTGPVQAWPEHIENLPLEIRRDIVNRLDADLEWARPRPLPTGRWVPRFVRRKEAEAQARDYHRFIRQAELAKSLMHVPSPELRKKGIELADRLEKILHERRNEQVERAYRK